MFLVFFRLGKQFCLPVSGEILFSCCVSMSVHTAVHRKSAPTFSNGIHQKFTCLLNTIWRIAYRYSILIGLIFQGVTFYFEFFLHKVIHTSSYILRRIPQIFVCSNISYADSYTRPMKGGFSVNIGLGAGKLRSLKGPITLCSSFFCIFNYFQFIWNNNYAIFTCKFYKAEQDCFGPQSSLVPSCKISLGGPVDMTACNWSHNF